MNGGKLSNSIRWNGQTLTLGIARRVHSASGINLVRPDLPLPGRSQPLGVEIMLDPMLAAEIAFHIVSPDLGDTTLDEFLEATTIERGEEFGAEIVADLADFFAGSSRPEMVQFVNGCKKTRILCLAMAQGMETLGSSLSSSEPSQDSTLGLSPSENSCEPYEPESEPNGVDSPP